MSEVSESKPGKSEKVLLRGGKILDPGSKVDKLSDIVIMNEKIEKIGRIE